MWQQGSSCSSQCRNIQSVRKPHIYQELPTVDRAQMNNEEPKTNEVPEAILSGFPPFELFRLGASRKSGRNGVCKQPGLTCLQAEKMLTRRWAVQGLRPENSREAPVRSEQADQGHCPRPGQAEDMVVLNWPSGAAGQSGHLGAYPGPGYTHCWHLHRAPRPLGAPEQEAIFPSRPQLKHPSSPRNLQLLKRGKS